MSPRRVTLADVAKAAGVSRSTASLVLSGRGAELRISDEVQERLKALAEEMGYRRNIVSAGLRTGRTLTIGFVSDTVATSRLAGDMIKGAIEAARDRGVLLFIGESEGDSKLEHALLEGMHDRQVDGIVFASMYTRRVTVPGNLRAASAVLLNAVPKTPSPLPVVVPDEVEAGRAAARVLLEAGHRDGIHLIGAGPGIRNVPRDSVAAVERLVGIREVFAEAGVEIASGTRTADWLPEHGFEATSALLRRTRPRALICLNDRLAFGAYQALDDASLRVPDDVSVVSFDDHPLASWMRPQLTTVALPYYELGRRAVDALFAEINGETTGEKPVHRIPMPLRTRASVTRPRQPEGS
ncbi:LacI family DNA-binding transcriptional regulator [Amycolatopsis tolypomycina]|uniref:Transcriptional regulator, LacI family n=1 Tax=Amycolatopsis tolypomycina TaxID=208445 RepID=A0A1H4SBC7_9PSEU|nr:LacI family DNA-binding transcriptional regulator [Amycolatopsis tolypomycina]SEC41462.1 transcriptional regulator, LacI family [Amycolatopsis tolypomycina]